MFPSSHVCTTPITRYQRKNCTSTSTFRGLRKVDVALVMCTLHQSTKHGSMKALLLLVVLTTTLLVRTTAFMVTPSFRSFKSHAGPLFALPSIEKMRISEIRQELESYGISTATFLEKKEMVEALNSARKDGKKPIEQEESAPKANGDMSRDDHIKSEMEKASKMKIGDLKKELEGRGVSTKSFFEKTEFVKAYAEAMVDGVARNTAGKAGSKGPAGKEEPLDPSYRDVAMQKFDRRDPRLAQSKVIDVRLGR